MMALTGRKYADFSCRKACEFLLPLTAVCVAYFVIETTYAFRMPLVMDEFNYAEQVYDHTRKIPHRNFIPTKTVLGFYIQSLPLYLTDAPWVGLMLIKSWMAVINTAFLALFAFLLLKHYRKEAVLLGLLLLVPMSTWLERSSAIRVDTMTALFGVVSLLMLMRGRPILAGVLCTTSFLVSQKAAYYVLAGDAALVVWLLVNRGKPWRELVYFNAAMLVALLAYLAFWSLFAPFPQVLKNTFLQQNYMTMALTYTHAGIRTFWFQTLARNPLFYGFGAVGLALLAARCCRKAISLRVWVFLLYLAAFAWIPLRWTAYRTDFLLATLVVAAVVAVLFLANRGRSRWLDWPMMLGVAVAGAVIPSWPYAFVILGAALLWPLFSAQKMREPRREEWLLMPYSAAVVFFCLLHTQPWPYFFVLLIPFVFLVLVSLFDRFLDDGIEWPRAGFCRPAVYGIVLALGVFFPLTRLPVALTRDSDFQRHTVELGHWLVQPEETYIDGINLLYRREQKVGSLSWLGAPALRRLNSMTDAELQEIIEEMQRQPVKLVVFNYRIEDLPQGLLMYLVPNFDHLWGNIMIYAPSFSPDDGQFAVKFSGHYRLETPRSDPIQIDGRQVAAGETLLLDKGLHQVAGDTLFRLVLAPEGIEEKADPRYRQEDRLFFRPYEY